MNRELFRKQIECAAHRAKLRGIRFSTTHGWGIDRKNGRVRLQNPTYLLTMFIEGAKSDHIGGYEHAMVAKALGISTNEAQAFSDGFCGGSSGVRDHSTGDRAFAYQVGREARKHLPR
jgi:hypothetical protein